MGRVCREYSSPARQCLGECKRADFVLFNSAEDTCAQPVPGPVVSRGVKMCFTAAGLQHPLHPPKKDPFCYDEKLSTMQVKTLQMNLGREQGCLDARAATAFAGRKVLKKKKNAALFSLFNEEAEAERLQGGWEGKHKSGKSFEQFGPATEMYLTVRYETPAFLPPPCPPFQLTVGPQANSLLIHSQRPYS